MAVIFENTGLGDYIHFRYENFKNMQTYRSFGQGRDAETLARETYGKLRTLMKNNQAQGNVEDIEQFYTSLYRQQYQGEVFSKYNIEITPEDAEYMESFLASQIGSRIGLTFDRQNLEVMTDIQALMRNSIKKYKGTKRGTQKILLSTMQRIIADTEQIIRVFSETYKEGAEKGVSASKLMKLGNNLSKLLVYKEQLKIIKQEVEAEGLRKSAPLRQSNDLLSGGVNIADIIDDIYAIIGQYSKPTKKQIGDTAEIAATVFDLVAGYKANQLTSQVVSEALTGGTSSGGSTTYKISGKYTDSEMIKKEFGKSSVSWDLESGNIVNVNASADTVDVTIQFADNNNIFKADRLTQSIKSYLNPNSAIYGGKISVISNTPLTAILMLTGVDFANSYLNYLADHDRFSESDSGEKIAVPTEMDNTIKYALAVRALSGARTDTYANLSQYFIVFVRSEQRVRVFTTTSLLEQISPEYSLFNDSFVTIDGFPIPGGSLNNVWADTVQARITSVLAQAHAKKLSMSLNTSNIF